MSLKRRNTSSPETDDSPASKRLRPLLEVESDDGFDHPFSKQQPRSDPIYGQKGAFPGLEDDDDELFYGPPSDGLEYLRMVRSEAKGVPHLLVAPRAPSKDDESVRNSIHTGQADDEDGGYYEDGAYTAVPAAASFPSTSDQASPDAQDLYYESLSARFKLLQASLKCSPPLSAIEALPLSCLITLPPDTETAQSQWRYHIQSSDPLTIQLACMDAETILEVVKLLTGIMAQTVRSRSRDRVWRFGAWIWGVLGKCRDRTELGSEEIAILRELGKRAVKLISGIREKASKANNDSQELLEQEDEDSQDSPVPDEPATDIAAQNTSDAEFNIRNGGDGFDEPAKDERGAAELEEAKNRLKGYFLSAVDVQSPSAAAVSGHAYDPLGVNTAQDEVDVDEQIKVILDMILTVVGDFYGQRDLLEFRDIWGEV